MLWSMLGAAMDLVHALLMAAWVLGLPLLFWRRHPRLSRAYAVFAIAFIAISQVSHAILGECFFTTIARALWNAGGAPVSHEWFTVRLAEAIFRLTPSHRAVVLTSEALILLTAVGVVFSLRRQRRAA